MESKGLERNVLVVANSDEHELWSALISETPALSDGSRLVCIGVGEWDKLMLVSYAGVAGKRLQVRTRNAGTHFVDIVIIRKLCRGLDATRDDHRNKLFALMHANVLCINTALSVYCCLDRPPVHAALSAIADRVGHQNFPLINQSYYESFRVMQFTPPAPFVVKVGHAEAGYGKVLFQQDTEDSTLYKDFCGCLALHSDYATAEPFFKKTHDVRVQKIGKHYRAYERRSSNWKTNVGTSILEEVPVKEKWQRWADLAGEIFGGMDILTVDLMVNSDTNEEIIVEVNDTASGFAAQNMKEDTKHVVEVMRERAEQAFGAKVVHAKMLQEVGQRTNITKIQKE